MPLDSCSATKIRFVTEEDLSASFNVACRVTDHTIARVNQIGDLAVGKARVVESRMQEEKSMSLARLRGDSEGILREGALHGGKDICGVVSYI